jgi:hypothetical protein
VIEVLHDRYYCMPYEPYDGSRLVTRSLRVEIGDTARDVSSSPATTYAAHFARHRNGPPISFPDISGEIPLDRIER